MGALDSDIEEIMKFLSPNIFQMDLFALVCPFKVRCFVVRVPCSFLYYGAITVLPLTSTECFFLMD
jgi:hypothetical protein